MSGNTENNDGNENGNGGNVKMWQPSSMAKMALGHQ
jgi:hypothetical protein